MECHSNMTERNYWCTQHRDEFPKRLAKEPDTGGCIWYDSMYMKSKTRQNLSGDRNCKIPWEGMMDWLGKRPRQLSRWGEWLTPVSAWWLSHRCCDCHNSLELNLEALWPLVCVEYTSIKRRRASCSSFPHPQLEAILSSSGDVWQCWEAVSIGPFWHLVGSLCCFSVPCNDRTAS